MKILTSREKRGKFFILFIFNIHFFFATNVTVMQCEYKKKQKQKFMKYFRKKSNRKNNLPPTTPIANSSNSWCSEKETLKRQIKQIL